MADALSDRQSDFESLIERIVDGGQPIAILVRAGASPAQTTFVTPDSCYQQVGFIVYPAEGEVARHAHVPVERQVVGTPEVLVVRKGRCELELYNSDKELVAVRELYPGDVVVVLSGGHALRMIEDTVLLEVKQGPYIGPSEKQTF